MLSWWMKTIFSAINLPNICLDTSKPTPNESDYILGTMSFVKFDLSDRIIYFELKSTDATADITKYIQ